MALPGLTSALLSGDHTAPVTGLRAFPKEDRPPVNAVFQMYHGMVAMGILMIVISTLGVVLWIRRRLFDKRGYLWILVFSVLGPQLANQLGWFAAEVGRQPWIVQGLLRTSEGLSKKVQADQVLASLILFGLVYLLLFVLFIFLLDRKIKQGPLDVDLKEALRIRPGSLPPLSGPRAEGF